LLPVVLLLAKQSFPGYLVFYGKPPKPLSLAVYYLFHLGGLPWTLLGASLMMHARRQA